jgi:hypothetical protein
MNREVPVTIRRTLQTAIDRNLISIEETLKNQLENILREVLETLTRNYFASVQSFDTRSETMAGVVEGADPGENRSTIDLNSCDLVQFGQFQIDALAPFSIPPDASSSNLAPLPIPEDNINTGASFSDSAYHSCPVGTENPSFDKSWFNPDPGYESVYESFFGVDLSGNSSFEMIAPDPPLDSQATETYTGKGKGRADSDSNSDTTQPDFGPWVPDRSV